MKQAISLALACAMVAAAVANAGAEEKAQDPTAPVSPGADARGQILLPSGRALDVEIADTLVEIQRGYMFREKISDNEGMLFLFPSSGFHNFWMKNCKVGLDIAWLDEHWRVVHLEENLPPALRTPAPHGRPSRRPGTCWRSGPGWPLWKGCVRIRLWSLFHLLPPPPPAQKPMINVTSVSSGSIDRGCS